MKLLNYLIKTVKLIDPPRSGGVIFFYLFVTLFHCLPLCHKFGAKRFMKSDCRWHWYKDFSELLTFCKSKLECFTRQSLPESRALRLRVGFGPYRAKMAYQGPKHYWLFSLSQSFKFNTFSSIVLLQWYKLVCSSHGKFFMHV